MSSSTEIAPAAEPVAARVCRTGSEPRTREDAVGRSVVHDFGGSLETGDLPRGPAETPWLLVAIVGVVLGASWARWRPRAAAPTVVARRRRALGPAAG